MSDGSSSTQCELVAISAALDIIDSESRDMKLVTDSKTAMQSLCSRSGNHTDLTAEVRRKLYDLRLKRINVHFIWAPSHVGIVGNEHADKLALQATRKPNVDITLPRSLLRTKTLLHQLSSEQWRTRIRRDAPNVATLGDYISYCGISKCDYVVKDFVKRRDQVTLSRVRIGYHYLWQVDNVKAGENRYCNYAVLGTAIIFGTIFMNVFH